jgi:hypothetical protein
MRGPIFALATAIACTPPSARDANAQQTLAGVPTARSNQLHLFAPVAINGSPIKWFLVDTGAPVSLVSPDVRHALSLPSAGNGATVALVSGVNGPYSGVRNVPLIIAKIPEFKLGDFDSSDLELGFCQLRGTDFGFTHEWGGIIGPELLFKRHAIIDLGNRALYLLSDKKK